jgi:hypothetical protein
MALRTPRESIVDGDLREEWANGLRSASLEALKSACQRILTLTSNLHKAYLTIDSLTREKR